MSLDISNGAIPYYDEAIARENGRARSRAEWDAGPDDMGWSQIPDGTLMHLNPTVYREYNRNQFARILAGEQRFAWPYAAPWGLISSDYLDGLAAMYIPRIKWTFIDGIVRPLTASHNSTDVNLIGARIIALPELNDPESAAYAYSLYRQDNINVRVRYFNDRMSTWRSGVVDQCDEMTRAIGTSIAEIGQSATSALAEFSIHSMMAALSTPEMPNFGALEDRTQEGTTTNHGVQNIIVDDMIDTARATIRDNLWQQISTMGSAYALRYEASYEDPSSLLFATTDA